MYDHQIKFVYYIHFINIVYRSIKPTAFLKLIMVGKDDIALRNDSLSEERELPGICWPVAKLRRKRNNNRPLCDQEQNLYSTVFWFLVKVIYLVNY